MDGNDVDALLSEQITYYRKRAPEYDLWWERTGHLSLPPDLEAEWWEERAALDTLIDEWLTPFDGGRALELACGTGNWTRRLAPHFREVVAVDTSPETMELARAKLHDGANVDFVVASVFQWEPPPAAFDVVFFSFWLSHVPPDRFEHFWNLVARALAPGGTAVLIDNKQSDGVYPRNDGRAPGDFVQVRTDLTSGEAHQIVKIYYAPDELEQRLDALGWDASITCSDRFFVMGRAQPRPTVAAHGD